MNDPMTILKQDHRQVKSMLEELSDSEPGEERQRTLAEVEQSLTLHMEIEEQILYPVVERIEGREPAEEANIEHRLAREGLAKARQMVDQPGFGAVAQMLLGGIEHHVEEEEKEILPSLKRELSREEWGSIGDAIVAAREAAGMPVPSQARSSSRSTASRSSSSRSSSSRSTASRSGSSRSGSSRGSSTRSGSSRPASSRSGTSRSTSSASGAAKKSAGTKASAGAKKTAGAKKAAGAKKTAGTKQATSRSSATKSSSARKSASAKKTAARRTTRATTSSRSR